MLKKIIIFLLVVFVVIQFIRPSKKNVETQGVSYENEIFSVVETSPEVENLIKMACYDCHSNTTVYPWYHNVQPVRWWLDEHIEDGKKHLNFHEFASYKLKKQDHKLEEVIEMVEEKEMPLKSYAIVHRDSDLTAEQRKMIIDWAKAGRVQLNYIPEDEKKD